MQSEADVMPRVVEDMRAAAAAAAVRIMRSRGTTAETQEIMLSKRAALASTVLFNHARRNE
jgi:predicted RNA binding protein with dsRBD fold (UPF0201 family)